MSSIYHKHHLFLTENAEFKPGPFNPTVYNMDVAGDTWRVGVIVCWEGFYPSVTGDWSQLDVSVVVFVPVATTKISKGHMVFGCRLLPSLVLPTAVLICLGVPRAECLAHSLVNRNIGGVHKGCVHGQDCRALGLEVSNFTFPSFLGWLWRNDFVLNAVNV